MRSMKNKISVFFRRTERKGFTLIELLIVACMLGGVSLALYSTLSNGIRIWRKVTQIAPEEELNIFFDKFSRDIRNSIRSANIAFSADSQMLKFASLVNSQNLGVLAPGEISYAYNRYALSVSRTERDASDIFSEREGVTREVLKGADAFRLSYYNYDNQTKEHVWDEEAKPGSMPLAVRIELEFKDAEKNRKFTHTSDIPVGE
jgi:type II secretion system protein J